MPVPEGRVAVGDTREEILEAAKALFSRHGFSGVSMQAIAEAAGVSKANVFHHFTSKSALYMALLRRVCGEATALLEDLERGGEDRPEGLREFSARHLEKILEDEAGSRLILCEVLESSPDRARALVEDVFGKDFGRLVEIIAAGQRAGDWREDIDPAFVAILLIAANVFFFLDREVLRHLPGVTFADDPERYSAQLADVLIHGIGRREPGPGGGDDAA